MKKRIALYLLVIAAVASIASTASAKAFDGGMVFKGPGHSQKAN